MGEFLLFLAEANLVTAAFLLGVLCIILAIIGRLKTIVELTTPKAILLALLGILLIGCSFASYNVSAKEVAESESPQIETATSSPVDEPTPTAHTSTPEGTATSDAALSPIAYDELARYPDKYVDVHFELRAKVVQVVSQTEQELWTRAYLTEKEYTWDDDVCLWYSGSLPQRLLEDDVIRFHARGDGLFEYQTVLGSTRTIPKLEIIRIIEVTP